MKLRALNISTLCLRFTFLLLTSFHSLVYADELIKEISCKNGEKFFEVKLIERKGAELRIMHQGGIKKLNFNTLDEKSSLLLGLKEYKEEIEQQEQKRLSEIIVNEKIRQQKMFDDAAIDNHRRAHLKTLLAQEKKDVLTWFSIYILSPDNELKKILGRPADFESPDGTLVWRNCCWNAKTEKLDDLWVMKKFYNKNPYDNSYIVANRLIFKCGATEYEEVNANSFLSTIDSTRPQGSVSQ